MPVSGSLETLKNKGYKVTSQRRAILRVLDGENRRLTAREIHAMMRDIQPRVSLDTIYRNLRLLVGIGILHQISLSSGAVFELNGDIRHHHHHLVCVECEKAVCVSYCPATREYSERAAEEGFTLLGHSFELFGRCADCSKKQN